MPRLSSKTTRLLLLAGLLLVLAACSPAALPAKVRDARAVAGPHYAQVYWEYPGSAGDFEVEQRIRVAGSDWSDWQPASAELAAVDRSALVVMQEDTDYQFRVGVWLDGQIQWQEAPETVALSDGVTLQVGTMNRWEGDELGGTAFLVYFDLPDDVAVPLELSFTGPAGWAAGAHPLDASVEHLEAGYIIDYLYELPALIGTYTLTVTDDLGAEWQDSVVFTDDDFRLPLSTGLQVTGQDLTAGTVSASWTPPVAGARTQVVLLDPAPSPVVAVSTYESTAAGSLTLTEVTGVTAGQELLLEVTASNLVMTPAAPVMPVPFGISVASTGFVAGD